MTESNEQGVPLPPPPPPAQGSTPNAPIYVTQGRSDKSLLVASILAGLFFITGFAGLHRFYVGKIGTGILMLITFGGLGIWSIIDLIALLTGNFRDRDNNRITSWSTPNPA